MSDAEDPKSMTCSLLLFTVPREMKKELMVLSRKARKCFTEDVHLTGLIQDEEECTG